MKCMAKLGWGIWFIGIILAIFSIYVMGKGNVFNNNNSIIAVVILVVGIGLMTTSNNLRMICEKRR